MDLLPYLGLFCVIYSLAELVGAAMRTPRSSLWRFGAVDVQSGRPIEVVCDRRRDSGSERRHSFATSL